ncbi:MAG: radical SAM protein [Syntrophales bacterium]|nr:radical SAM protein [Syntrophales bacterium]
MSWKLKKKYSDLLAGEDGFEKKVWGDHLTVCLVYPNTYRTGMSNLGFQTVYRLLNANPAVICERAFLPDPEDEMFFSSGSLPLFSIESQKPLRDFDVLAFSLSFENDYPNILTILSMGRINPVTAGRTAADPLILAGGIAVTMNPEPLADFFDLVILGEAEEVLPEIMQNLIPRRQSEVGRDDLLFDLQRSVDGVYVPKLYQVIYKEDGPIKHFRPVDPSLPVRIKKRSIRDIDAFNTDQAIIASETALGTMFLTEVSRGCARGCRFCAAGYLYRPPRFRHLNTLKASLLQGLEKVNRIGLLGTAVSDHPDLLGICRFILDRAGRIAIGSLRLDQLTGDLVGLLKEGGIETLSLAPEAGSQRLRDLIRKGIRGEQILEMAVSLLAAGIVNIRTYFMIGLPSETDDDVDALVELVRMIAVTTVKSAGGRDVRFRSVTVNINQFIPKPATPLQWYPLEKIEIARRRLRRIKAALAGNKSVKIQAESLKSNYIQALLSLGDRRVGQMILAQHEGRGNWSRTFKDAPLHPDFWVYRAKDPEEMLPWDFIDHGVSKSHLLKEYRKTQEYF